MRSASWIILLPLLLPACGKSRQQAALPRAGASASVSATVTAPAASISARAVERGLDLLHRTASVVVTSSHADGSSTGAYLVDELPETSWKPNPPDRAAWIEIQLPAPAAIERIEVQLASASASASASRSSLEPFAKVATLLVPDPEKVWSPLSTHHRWGEGSVLVLEPERPTTLMRVRLSLSGMPRGARVAELRVIGGIAASEVLEPAIPETQFQGKPRVDYAGALFAAWVLGAPYATEEALCGAFKRALPVDPESISFVGEVCRKLPDIVVSGTAPAEIRAVQRYQLVVPFETSQTDTTALVIHADRGLYPANLALTDTRNEGMCPNGPEGDMTATNLRFEHGNLLIDRARYFTPGILMMSTPNVAPPVAAGSVVRCHFEGRLICREFITRFGSPDTVLDDGYTVAVKLPKTWDWTRTVTVTPRGSVRLSPCRTTESKDKPSRVVPCATPGAEVL